jgi:GNAT superfamily N-acetyltransferase
MDPAEVLARYDREVRRRPTPEPGTLIERAPGIVRSVGRTNCILFSELTAATVEEAAAAQRTRYAELGREVEWKVYGHDPPPDLGPRLESAGFRAEPPETLMVLPLAAAPGPGAPPPGVTVRRVGSEREFSDAVAATRDAFGLAEDPRLAELADRVADPAVAFYVAYVGGRPVGSGRVEAPDGCAFAGLWGGGIVPEHRHRGIYRALVATRLAFARARGAEFATVDAAPTSRPILERCGFEPLDTVQGFTWAPA